MRKYPYRGWRDGLAIRAFAALGEDMSSVPSTYKLLTAISNSCFRESEPSTSKGTKYTRHRHVHAGKILYMN